MSSSPPLRLRLVEAVRLSLARLAHAPPASPGPGPRATPLQRAGSDGERIAREHLEAAGLVFVAGNVRYRDGELDLVMREPDPHAARPTLVFVEVRRRGRDARGTAAETVTFAKRRRLVAAAAHFLAAERARPAPVCRFDVVAIDACGDDLAVRWIRDAFACRDP